jgi:hypothetical protein
MVDGLGAVFGHVDPIDHHVHQHALLPSRLPREPRRPLSCSHPDVLRIASRSGPPLPDARVSRNPICISSNPIREGPPKSPM